MSISSTPIPDRIYGIGRSGFGDAWAAGEIFQAPGRIELIGNHLDYNGGPVLAAAIDRKIAIGLSTDGIHGAIRVIFGDLGARLVHTVEPPWSNDWQSTSEAPEPVDYLRGVITALSRRGIPVRRGIDLVVTGDLPHGIGISSSAALCVALVLAVASERPEPAEIVLIAQEAEHRVGSPCGTMDQSASVYGGLIRYDGASGEVVPVAADLRRHRLVVVNSGVVRSLATSAYPERVRETAQAVQLLRERWRADLTALAAIQIRELAEVVDALESAGEPTLAKRVRHVVTETDRVHRAERAIADADWIMVGRLMTESGQSSALNYEISHRLVEQVVTICRNHPGVRGARMMGGGQGGSALVLVAEEAVAGLLHRLDSDYFKELGNGAPQIRTLPCTFAAGAGRMSVLQAS
jgi:galactokinase